MPPVKPACGCCSRRAAMVRVGVGLGPVAWSMRSVKPSTAVWRELPKAANCADSMPAFAQPAGQSCCYCRNECLSGSSSQLAIACLWSCLSWASLRHSIQDWAFHAELSPDCMWVKLRRDRGRVQEQILRSCLQLGLMLTLLCLLCVGIPLKSCSFRLSGDSKKKGLVLAWFLC